MRSPVPGYPIRLRLPELSSLALTNQFTPSPSTRNLPAIISTNQKLHLVMTKCYQVGNLCLCVYVFYQFLIYYNVDFHFCSVAQLLKNMGIFFINLNNIFHSPLPVLQFHMSFVPLPFTALPAPLFWPHDPILFLQSVYLSLRSLRSFVPTLSYLRLSISIFELYPFIPYLLHPLQSSSALRRGGRERARHRSSTKRAACSLHRRNQRTSGIEGSKAGESWGPVEPQCVG